MSGCSSSGTPSADGSPSAEPAAPRSAPPPPAPPTVGSCHALDLKAATDPVDDRAAVPCSAAHTTVTIKVGRLAPLSDGHLLAVDSPQVQAQVAKACPPALPAYVGGDRTTQRLSRLQVVPFSPSLEQADAGASWFRCDLLALRSEGQLVSLPARMKDALAAPGALDRFGTCGTAAPGSKGFAQVVCSERHAWRAVEDVDIAAKTYLDRDATAQGDAACKAIASAKAAGSLKFSWSFQWPTKAEWDAGRRWGLCWLPEG